MFQKSSAMKPAQAHHALRALNLCQIKFLNFPLINGTKRTRGAEAEKVIYPSGLSQNTQGTATASGLIWQQTAQAAALEQDHALTWASSTAMVRSRHAYPAFPTHCMQTSPRAQRSCPPATRSVFWVKTPKPKQYSLLSKLVTILQRHERGSTSRFLGFYGIFCSKRFQTDEVRKKQAPQAPQN